ncbi:MAG TPA: hypothetical protein VFQ43_04840 [Nitrososphaera sp.]|nr:hypothetical protein [Nitrososphaera sp.]
MIYFDMVHAMSEQPKPKAVDELRHAVVRYKRVLLKVLPTDRLTVEKQIELLRAFAVVYEANGGKPVKNEDAGNAVTPAKAGATVILTNAFFVDIGLLKRGDNGGFEPSADLIAYNNACQWGEETAKEKLRPVFEGAWFCRCLVPRLRLATQTEANCLAILAEESGAQKEHGYRLQNLIGFLEFVGILRSSDGKITLLPSKQTAPVQTPEIKNSPQFPPDVSPSAKMPAPRFFGGGEHEPEVHTFVLPLDKENKRKITVTAPLDVTAKEVQRIAKWLEVQLLVEGLLNEP